MSASLRKRPKCCPAAKRRYGPYNQPPDHYQVEFSSNEACEAARLQLIKDAERIRQSMIDGATAQDRQIGSNNKTALVMAAISNAPYVSAVCVQTSAG